MGTELQFALTKGFVCFAHFFAGLPFSSLSLSHFEILFDLKGRRSGTAPSHLVPALFGIKCTERIVKENHLDYFKYFFSSEIIPLVVRDKSRHAILCV